MASSMGDTIAWQAGLEYLRDTGHVDKALPTNNTRRGGEGDLSVTLLSPLDNDRQAVYQDKQKLCSLIQGLSYDKTRT